MVLIPVPGFLIGFTGLLQISGLDCVLEGARVTWHGAGVALRNEVRVHVGLRALEYLHVPAHTRQSPFLI